MSRENRCLRLSFPAVWIFSMGFGGVPARAQVGPDGPANWAIAPAQAQGAATCASTACHGGATDQSRQYVLWSQRDVHSRAFATLATARAARMAEALHLDNPAANARCTACHAPFGAIAPELLSSNARVNEGVSCVSCHGAADSWLRSHTRLDLTHAERVAAGMRELRDLRLRANACVACHQNIDPDLINQGRHPTLLFELDGQSEVEPKHWRETAGFNGAQAWYVGQVVAWREMSWARLHGGADAAPDTLRWKALRWLVRRAGLDYGLPAFQKMSDDVPPELLGGEIELADNLARRAAQNWRADQTLAVLKRLASTADDFRSTSESVHLQACRAERLVLAFDRLLGAMPANQHPDPASAQLDRLFELAQSAEDFVPSDFALELARFAQVIGPSQAAD